ncbi:MAG: aminotransferase class I/II-fold pyridoxal phosphate-dependent enzyme [Reyranella sp.]|jgi:8-amino-7-oxononanoate synthase|uniref:aminotransferase class I/II-fold pyridoxal phosphate-dependent enzyme n=1 Tax=Reyranella sp. TaxID=1929291 RepID=UPI00096905C5|nr:aminotransferase class I/II-fold pyridoxal phosphate-dependent enzyme [Reyranella sp.]MBN9539920.1 aminotransferase class I/II-fold pyridoxal phosphate-dependent enzyme [Alphaproteobacteria bacterium]MBR2819935.1 aminotransferase class I/II-fold pyridoxal phosphate-dependent enzyme [Reyranella sp.]OJU45460.1 MAG: 8-amino-7-oxononanoate synthase [Alphaproteobacteria bacterium 65-37]
MPEGARSSDEALDVVNRVRQALAQPSAGTERPSQRPPQAAASEERRRFDFGTLPEYEMLKLQKAAGEIAGIDNPFYRLHDGRAAETTSVEGKEVVNFSSYDYLGLNTHPDVGAAAKAAIDKFGTSVGASRLTAGERQVHRDLETLLAELHGVEDALSFVSGHATNVSVIGGLLGPDDLLVSDALIHNSVVEGAKLSGAKRILCPHGDLEAIERALRLNRRRHRRALIIVEGLYSMDGDVPDLAALVRLKRRYDAWLMVDEAHSVGVLGATGRGIAEEQGVDPVDVDIWMGTLSKSLASTGGYVAGSRKLIELLKYTSPGFVYSVGGCPSVAAAAGAALDVMRREPWRLERLRQNGRAFVAGAKARGLDVGLSIGASVVPIIVGNSPSAVILSHRLLARGYNVIPIIFPGVAENQARLRFFITSRHTQAHIDGVLDAIAQELPEIRKAPSFVNLVAGR